MKVLIWIANHALWISLVGAFCSAAVRFERLLPRRVHRLALFLSLFVTFASPLLGLLKKNLDDHWKGEMQEQVAAAMKASQPKPLKERLIACLNEIDPRIVQGLAAGTVHSQGILKPYQLSELQKLAAEPGANEYITLTLESAIAFMDQGGTGTPAKIELKPALLK
jgi:hypothetical protein